MNVLPAQASAVPCERVFSSSKETTTMRRNQITAPLMESLQMVKYMLKKVCNIFSSSSHTLTDSTQARLNMTARLDPTDIEYEMELATVRLQNDVDDNDDFLTS
ncbi:hypothetical protein BV25DRAFT_1977935 [Artomyces pyxidatus]|uniref:Uncharacterized protein n=1 Tax=Artomyces pyxidatus TaxID=48021 RepID=A0ACB8SJ42_9AGAM|nr:hypothetical protein BV25DRAFT_1977935 [Artomyces pyxidatus]